MLESFKGHELQYKKLTPEEMESRGILGRLVGPMCDTKAATRNGRVYNKELWENALNDELFLEKLNNKCLFSELGHPDRTEVDMREACAALAERPKLGDDGLIYGVWDILNTPNGKILKAFCDYGTTIGISSRGEGDVEEDWDGTESVTPESYALETFDMVILPAMKKARLQTVNEALDTKKYNKSLRQKLTEELDKAEVDDRRIMEETLNRLDITLTESKPVDLPKGIDPVEYEEDHPEITEATSFDGLIYAEKLGRVMKAEGKSDEQIAEVFRLSGMSENEIKDTLAMLNMKEESCNEELDKLGKDKDQYLNKIQGMIFDLMEIAGKSELPGYAKKAKAAFDAWNNCQIDPEALKEELNSLDKEDAKYFDDQIAKELERLINLAMEADNSGARETSKILQHAYDLIADNGMKIVEECNSQINEDKLEDILPKVNLADQDKDIVDMFKKAGNKEKCLMAVNKVKDDLAMSQYLKLRAIIHTMYEECNNESCTDKNESKSESVVEDVKEAVDNSSLIKAIQEAVQTKKALEEKVMSLQSEKAVSDTKVEQITEELNRYKNLSAQLSTISREAKSKFKKLSEELKLKNEEANSKALKESLKVKATSKKLNEALQVKDDEIKKLNEELNSAKADLNIKISSFNKKIEKQTKLTEAYRAAANSIMSSYIKSKAAMLGITVNEIKSRLDESYTVEDVDRVCEDLRAYKLSIDSLPFKVGSRVVAKFTESKNDNLRIKQDIHDIDDEVDETLLNMLA